MANGFQSTVARVLHRYGKPAVITWPSTGISRTGTSGQASSIPVRALVTRREEKANNAVVQATTVLLPATAKSVIGATLAINGGPPRQIIASDNGGGAGDDAAFQLVTLT